MNHKDITVDDVMNMNVSSLDEAVKKVAKKYYQTMVSYQHINLVKTKYGIGHD